MITKGQIVLFKFPQTDQKEGKLRPALILRELPGKLGLRRSSQCRATRLVALQPQL